MTIAATYAHQPLYFVVLFWKNHCAGARNETSVSIEPITMQALSHWRRNL